MFESPITIECGAAAVASDAGPITTALAPPAFAECPIAIAFSTASVILEFPPIAIALLGPFSGALTSAPLPIAIAS